MLLAACGSEPTLPARYEASDALYAAIRANLNAAPDLEIVAEIDHSRLAAERGAHMPPARAIIFRAPEFEKALLRLNPLAGVDLPLRVLAYEESPGGESAVIYNEFDYLASRYDLPDGTPVRGLFDEVMGVVLAGIAPDQINHFETNAMQPDGIITTVSAHDMDTTRDRILEAIAGQDDAVTFGSADLPSPSGRSHMILFGAPVPGARAMGSAPTLGLDAFCQKFLLWEDEDGVVRLSYSDLGALAERQGVGNSIALRVIDFRLGRTFAPTLEESS